MSGSGSPSRRASGVKVAATLPYEQTHAVEPFHAFLETFGIPSEKRIIRALARRVSPTEASNSPSRR